MESVIPRGRGDLQPFLTLRPFAETADPEEVMGVLRE
jgi:hypothetical protein